MNIEQARFNMVEQQIRTWEVLDQNVLDLLFVVRREEFVPPAHRLLAFADLELPLGGGATMWSPKMEARVLQELEVASGESVLEIGTGSGYFSALLAGMGARVTSVEIDPLLSAEAGSSFSEWDSEASSCRSATARTAGAGRRTTRSCSPDRRRCCPTASCGS
jgi:protein-L-isoaspartate(D-aspartate) O-methyltransferase